MRSALTRRSFVASAPLAALAVVASARAQFFTRHHLPIGIQLYTLGELIERDLDGTLAALAKVGFQSVEMASFLGRSPRDLRAAFDHAGLVCRSAHIPAQPRPSEPFSLSGDLGRLVDAAHVIGLQYVVAPTFVFPDRLGPMLADETGAAYLVRAAKAMTVEDWRANARFLNEQGAILRRAGLQLAYHNHNLELAKRGETDGLQILLRETDPASVCFEMDVGWLAAAGYDPLEFLARYPGRFKLMHVKDIQSSTVANTELQLDPTEVGAGIIPWGRILPAALRAGTTSYFLEQEPPFRGSRLDSVSKSFKYLSHIEA
jgi:sugar phosphate isomerase/epimerase